MFLLLLWPKLGVKPAIKRTPIVSAGVALLLVVIVAVPGWVLAEEEQPPFVKILWPNTNTLSDSNFGYGTTIKIKAEVFDPDRSISEVRFYVMTNLVGVVTNPPYAVVWRAYEILPGSPYFMAIAIDNRGRTTESDQVAFRLYDGATPKPIVKVVSPESGSVLMEPSTFDFTAEVMAATSGIGAIDFYIGSNVVGRVDYGDQYLTATSPPLATVTITNLPQGEYDLYLRNRSRDFNECRVCYVLTNHIQVGRVRAQSIPRLAGEPFQFEIETSFTNRPNVIERSSDLHHWTAIGTNTPSTSRFSYVESASPLDGQQFYRVVVRRK